MAGGNFTIPDGALARTVTSTGDGASATDAAPSTRGTTEKAAVLPLRYRVEREVARGGLGRVLLAYDARLGRFVAIKELLKRSGELQARFSREVAITARLQHPGIVPVYDAGAWDDGEPFYVMKLLSNGRTLKEVVDETDELDERMALLPNVIAVADALAYAHSLGIIHRDIKPANVIVGRFGETVVIDWGLAKDLEEPTEDFSFEPYPEPPVDATVAGKVLGTPQYMAPEQARGDRVDRRADVYAIGALLYYVLAKHAPHTGGGAHQLLERVRNVPPQPLAARVDGIPLDLRAIVEKAMSASPDARYADAQELVDDLRRFHTGRLVRAHDYSMATLMRRWARRHRSLLAAAAAFIAILVAMGMVGIGRIEHARTVAERERAAAYDKRNELILLQARSALEHDPTRAIAWLKSYPRDGADVNGVQAVAAEAHSLGVAKHALPTGMLIVASFVSDTRTVVTAGFGRKAALWDTVEGRSLADVPIDGDATALDLSPDGNLAAVVTMKGELLLWNLRTRTSRVLAHEPSALFCVAFSPDGAKLAASGVGAVYVWTLKDGNVRVLRDHRGSVYALSFSRDGTHVISGDLSGRLLVTSLLDGTTVQLASGGGLRAFAISDDRSLVVVGRNDGTLRLLPLDGGAPRTVGVPGPVLTNIRFLPREHRFATGGTEGVISLWDADGRLVRRAQLHHAEISQLAAAPDGSVLASGSRNGELQLWDVATGEAQPLRGHGEIITTLAFAHDGTLLSGGTDLTARIWTSDARSRKPIATLDIGDPAMHVVFSPDGAWLASEGGRLVHVCAVATLECRSFAGHRAIIYGLAFAADSRHLVSAGWDGTARVWNVADGSARVFETPGALVRRVLLTEDGSRLIVAGSDGLIRIWPLAGGTATVLRGHVGDVAVLALSPAGDRLVSGGEDGTVRKWDLSGGGGDGAIVTRHARPVVSVAWSPDGARVASSARDGSVHVWQPSTGSVTELAGHHDLAATLGFSTDGLTLAAASWDGTASVWDLQSGRREVLRGHDNRVRAIALTPDARTIATASDDRTVRLWDHATADTDVLTGFTAPVRAVAFSPDGRLIAAGSDDHTVRLWRNEPRPSVPRAADRLWNWMSSETTLVQ